MRNGIVNSEGKLWPVTCHGRVGSLIFILSYLKTRDPGRILPYVEERHVRILIG